MFHFVRKIAGHKACDFYMLYDDIWGFERKNEKN